jgi:hypothetical protein
MRVSHPMPYAESTAPRGVCELTSLSCAILSLALGCCAVPPKTSDPSLTTTSSVSAPTMRAPTRASPNLDPQSTDRELGQVFESAKAFARSRYSEPGAPVSVLPVADSTWVWLVEGSASPNRVWHLFEQLPDGRVKYLLCHPGAERVEGASKVTTDAIEFVQSFAPLAAEQRVSYEFDATRGYYAPRSCRLRVRRPPAVHAEGAANDQVEGACRAASAEPFVEIPVDCEGHAGHCQ